MDSMKDNYNITNYGHMVPEGLGEDQIPLELVA
jgi:hypothetical protein